MEVKIKIPTLFAKYRVVKKGGFFYSQKRVHGNKWYWLDRTGYAWGNGYGCNESNREFAASFSTLEEAITLIENTRTKVVWSGR